MITNIARIILFAVLSVSVAGCSLPRGAALQSEITEEVHNGLPSYSVVDVTRNTVPQIAEWPVTGWSGSYNWLSGTRGPRSAVLRAGDKVDLAIWDSQENSLITNAQQKVTNMPGLVVSSSGTIFVPYIDEVVVAGQTPTQARREIQARLAEILPSAQVQLAFSAGEGNSVDLVAGVKAPGTFPLPHRNYRILSLISQGGGIAQGLRNPLVRLIRNGRTYEIPSKELLSNPARNIVLRGGDQVVVEEDERFFMALGATGKEELVYFDREYVTALEAMSMIGGILDARANPKGVLILREYPKSAVTKAGHGPDMQQVVFVIDLTSADGLFAARNFQINPNDTVLVTESPVTVANTMFSLVGRLFIFGNQASSL